MKRQITPTRTHKVRRDTNLKVIRYTSNRNKQVARIKKQRSKFQKQKQKHFEKFAEIVDKRDGKRQKELSVRQARKHQKAIRKHIRKKRKLLYKDAGGDIAFRDKDVFEGNWFTNFVSSNVWKFKRKGDNLLVAFLDGSVYMYFNAWRKLLGMINTGSKGKYVWNQLRRKGVRYTRIL